MVNPPRSTRFCNSAGGKLSPSEVLSPDWALDTNYILKGMGLRYSELSILANNLVPIRSPSPDWEPSHPRDTLGGIGITDVSNYSRHNTHKIL